MGIKPHDMYGVPMCAYHHRRAHDIGHDAMARGCGLDLDYLFQTAAWLAAHTPDKRLREAMNA